MSAETPTGQQSKAAEARASVVEAPPLPESPVKFQHNGFENRVDRMAQGVIDSHPGTNLTAAYRAVAVELDSARGIEAPREATPGGNVTGNLTYVARAASSTPKSIDQKLKQKKAAK